MSIDISPQLGSILARRQMTEDDLARRIRERFDLAADATMIARLAQQDSLHNTDVELALAAAQILGVSLDDLFRIVDSPPLSAALSEYDRDYLPDKLAPLLDDSIYDDESPEGQGRVDALLAEYGRVIYDRHLQAYADEHGITIEQAREVVMRDFVDKLHRFDATAALQVEKALARDALIERGRVEGTQSGE